MNTLENLDGRELGIKSLNGLETATNLHSLNLSHNRISDLTPLAYLTQLQVLSLDSNEISDIAPLAYCRLMIIDCLEQRRTCKSYLSIPIRSRIYGHWPP